MKELKEAARSHNSKTTGKRKHELSGEGSVMFLAVFRGLNKRHSNLTFAFPVASSAPMDATSYGTKIKRFPKFTMAYYFKPLVHE